MLSKASPYEILTKQARTLKRLEDITSEIIGEPVIISRLGENYVGIVSILNETDVTLSPGLTRSQYNDYFKQVFQNAVDKNSDLKMLVRGYKMTKSEKCKKEIDAFVIEFVSASIEKDVLKLLAANSSMRIPLEASDIYRLEEK